MPGPDATLPPGVGVIPNLTIEALAGLWSSVGLSCESSYGSFPGAQGGYHIQCERTDTGADTAYVGESVYWTMDGVQTVSLILNSVTIGGTVDGPGTAGEVLLPTVELVGGQEARGWLEARLADSACLDECIEVFGRTKFILYAGVRGGYSLHVEQEPP